MAPRGREHALPHWCVQRASVTASMPASIATWLQTVRLASVKPGTIAKAASTTAAAAGKAIPASISTRGIHPYLRNFIRITIGMDMAISINPSFK